MGKHEENAGQKRGKGQGGGKTVPLGEIRKLKDFSHHENCMQIFKEWIQRKNAGICVLVIILTINRLSILQHFSTQKNDCHPLPFMA